METHFLVRSRDDVLKGVAGYMAQFGKKYDLEPWFIGKPWALDACLNDDPQIPLALLGADEDSREIHGQLQEAGFRGAYAIYSENQCDWAGKGAFYLDPTKTRMQQYEIFEEALQTGLAALAE